MSRRLAAVLEVLGVYSAGQLVMALLIRSAGLQVVNPLAALRADVTGAELVSMSGQLSGLLALQYAGWFLLIVPINWWHRRRRPSDYGLGMAGRPWRFLLVAGMATTALADWPNRLVELINAVRPLGSTVPWRQAIFDMSWARWEFWLFMAVGSFAFIPVVEELFYRGYCQRRLAEDWGDGPAIVGMACLFTFSHGQYLILNPYNAAMVASLLVSAVGLGVVFAWTRSLVPSIVAHAVINVPMTPRWQALVLGLMVVGAALAGKRGGKVLREVFGNTRARAAVVLAAIGVAYAVLAQRVEAVALIAVAMLIAAIGLEAMEKRARQGPAPEPTGGSRR